jgi:predicted metalloendopeptidase
MPLAMLQSGYFQGGDPLFDYSRLGSTIAHEMLHHFDSHGIGYNQTMYQTSWVSNSTLHSFEERTQCLVDQYFSYYFPEVGLYLNGSQTLDENLADNGGLRQAFKAFRTLVQQGQVDSQSTQYSQDQLFFISYATVRFWGVQSVYLIGLVAGLVQPRV